jgi:hypothetical protein
VPAWMGYLIATIEYESYLSVLGILVKS